MSALCYSVGLAYLVYHALREKSRAWEYFICCLQKSKIRRQKEKEDADGILFLFLVDPRGIRTHVCANAFY